MDESATGSANPFWHDASAGSGHAAWYDPAVHFPPHPPSIAPGVAAFIWAVVFGVFVWIGLLAIGAPLGTSVAFGALTVFLSFVIIRVRGSDAARS